MAWFISWKSLIMMWAGGPLMMVTACLAAYCYCTYPRKKKKPIIPRGGSMMRRGDGRRATRATEGERRPARGRKRGAV
jgi:hypothetical protein